MTSSIERLLNTAFFRRSASLGGGWGNDDCQPMIMSQIDKCICFHGNATPNNRRLRSPNKINMWCLKNVHLTIRFNHWALRYGLFDWRFVASVAILREDTWRRYKRAHMCRHTGTHACDECLRDGCFRWFQQTETDCHAHQTRPLWWRGVSFLFYTSHFALLMTFADSQRQFSSQNYESLIPFILLRMNAILYSAKSNAKSQAFKLNLKFQHTLRLKHIVACRYCI